MADTYHLGDHGGDDEGAYEDGEAGGGVGEEGRGSP